MSHQFLRTRFNFDAGKDAQSIPEVREQLASELERASDPTNV